jgi:hypothetical protein
MERLKQEARQAGTAAQSAIQAMNLHFCDDVFSTPRE